MTELVVGQLVTITKDEINRGTDAAYVSVWAGLTGRITKIYPGRDWVEVTFTDMPSVCMNTDCDFRVDDICDFRVGDIIP